jgi:hypothetical protein
MPVLFDFEAAGNAKGKTVVISGASRVSSSFIYYC